MKLKAKRTKKQTAVILAAECLQVSLETAREICVKRYQSKQMLTLIAHLQDAGVAAALLSAYVRSEK